LPTITGSDGLIANSFGLIKPPALPNVYAVSFCDPAATNPSSAMAAFITTYKAKYGGLPSNYAPLAYDAVFVAVAAVKQAGSVAPAAVKDALQKVDYTAGACAADYHSDAAHVLIHENQVSHFASDGTSTIVAKYPVPPKS
jgi:branched-chain amino acid transport system substrate-binding protein